MQNLQDDNKIKSQEDDEIDLLALAMQIWNGRLIVATSFSLAALLGFVTASVTPPVWRADALVQLEARSGLLAFPEGFSDLIAGPAPSTMAEIEILRSRSILRDAAATLKLDWQVLPRRTAVLGDVMRYGRILDLFEEGFAAYPRLKETVVLSYLQVPSAWIGEPLLLTVTGADRFEIALPDGHRLSGEVGTVLVDQARAVSLTIDVIRAAPGREFEVLQVPEPVAVSVLSGTLSVAEQGRQTGILRVSMTAPTPREAERRLDAVLKSYTEKSVVRNASEVAQSLAFVDSQLPITEAQVQEAENALNSFRAKKNSVDIAFETESLLSEAGQLEEELRAIALNEGELRQRYTPSHPIYRQAIEARLSIERRLTEVKTQIDRLPDTQREVVNLTRKLEVAQATYIELLNRAQELRVLQASEIGNARVVDRAEATAAPIEPRTSRIVSLAGILGLLLGVGLVFLKTWLRRGILVAEEIERLGIPVLGITTLAKIPSRSSRGAVPLSVEDDPESVDAEAFRSIRTALRFVMANEARNSLSVTSTMPGAGKSYCAANLAAIAAQAGLRVCLVDADLRRGAVHHTFQQPAKSSGLAEYLLGGTPLGRVILPCEVEGLDVICTGRRPPNPAELLMSHKLQELCAALEAEYDLVIFDTPPALLVTDAVLLSRTTSLTVLVVRHGETEPGELMAARKAIETAGGRVNGAILNAFDPKKVNDRPYGYGRYGYGYKYRYGGQYKYARREEE